VDPSVKNLSRRPASVSDPLFCPIFSLLRKLLKLLSSAKRVKTKAVSGHNIHKMALLQHPCPSSDVNLARILGMQGRIQKAWLEARGRVWIGVPTRPTQPFIPSGSIDE